MMKARTARVTKVKVGIVGCGLVSHSHIEAFRSHPDAEIIAVCDINEAQAKLLSKKYGIPQYYTSYNEMLKSTDINTISIVTPTYLHSEMAIAAAKAGKHILCEKPFCMTLEGGAAACAEAEKRGISLMVGESFLFISSVMKAKELIDSGEIGKPRQIRQRFGVYNLRGNALVARCSGDMSWRTDPTRAGGGGYPWMFDHCVHFFAVAECMFNNSPVKEVYAVKVGAAHENYDVPMIVWKHEDSECHGIWMGAKPESNDFYDPMGGFSMTVIGDKGMIEVLGEGGGGLKWKGKDVHLVLHRKGKETLTYRFDEGGDEVWDSEISYYNRAHRNQIYSFINSLLKGERPVYGGSDGLRAVKNTMAAICSAKEGVPVGVAGVTDARVEKSAGVSQGKAEGIA